MSGIRICNTHCKFAKQFLMEDAFIVKGGKPLSGTVGLSGAKNVALKVLIAALLFRDPVRFSNIPNIKDISELIHLLESLGVVVKRDKDRVEIDPSGLNSYTVDLLHGSKTRVSFMLFAPLLHKFGEALIPNPGGCRIGARPIDRHIKMLESFQVDAQYNSNTGYYTAKVNGGKLKGSNYIFDKPTHTGTELAIMFAALCHGKSVIKNAAQEPEIDDLISFLNIAGAKIARRDSTIEIEGVSELTVPDEPYRIMFDRNEAPTYAAFALATKGDITVKGVVQSDIYHFVNKVKETGGGVETIDGGVRFFYKGILKATDITTLPHPGFMTDWQGPWAVLMTQAKGTSTIHETVFENRFGYVSELKKLSARIEYFQPQIDDAKALYQFRIDDTINLSRRRQAIKITGPTTLHNGALYVNDLRAGATVLIAACVARGESVVLGASTIDRGYEHIEEKLRKLGANIQRV